MMAIYRLGTSIYKLALSLAAIWHIKARLQVGGRKKTIPTIKHYRSTHGEKQTLWMHCSSLGEYEQGAYILRLVRRDLPHWGIVLSFYSPSGYEVLKDRNITDAIFYLPADTKREMQQVVTELRPTVVINVKYDYWYTLLDILHQHRIPVAVVAARFKSDAIYWRSWAVALRRTLATIDHFFLLRDTDAALVMRHLPEASHSVDGDPRVDTVLATAYDAPRYASIEKHRKQYTGVIIYGSVWQDDIEVCTASITKYTEYLHIIAPHEISNIDSWTDAFDTCLMSQSLAGNIIVVDTIGHLKHLYQYADLVYIGGGFHHGLHNTLEPGAHYCPLMLGPHYDEFPEAIYFVENGLAVSINRYQEVQAAIDHLLEKDTEEIRARYDEFFDQNRGASQIVIDYIRRYDQ